MRSSDMSSTDDLPWWKEYPESAELADKYELPSAFAYRAGTNVLISYSSDLREHISTVEDRARERDFWCHEDALYLVAFYYSSDREAARQVTYQLRAQLESRRVEDDWYHADDERLRTAIEAIGLSEDFYQHMPPYLEKHSGKWDVITYHLNQ